MAGCGTPTSSSSSIIRSSRASCRNGRRSGGMAWIFASSSAICIGSCAGTSMRTIRRPMAEALEALLGPTTDPILLAGGASKEAWSVDASGERLLVRRAAGGVIHRHTLSLRDEFDVLTVACEAGVKVPRPIMYIEDLDGREAFVMERLAGETIGRRIVRMEVPAQLPMQMAEELAKTHAIPPARLPF